MYKNIFWFLCVCIHIQAADIMSYEVYAQIKHKSPYIFRIKINDQYLFYFGANHSPDPVNKQYLSFDLFWQEFLEQTAGEPRVALVEGGLRRLMPSKEEAIIDAGAEGGLLTFYAQQENISVECPEPNEQDVINVLRKHFSDEAIAYKEFAQFALCAHRYAQVRKHFSKEQFIEECLAPLQCYFSFPLTVEEMEKIHGDIFGGKLNLNHGDFFYEITNPVEVKTLINEVCRTESIMRDQHIVAYIQRLLAEGKHVFVAYGHTHAVMQEPALRAGKKYIA